jgi:hypothetical protein
MRPTWRIARLLWSPWDLAPAAVRTPTWLACGCGMVAGLLIAAAPLHAWALPAGAPYADIWEYFIPPMTVEWAIVVALFLGACAAAVFVPTAWPSHQAVGLRERAATRVVLLSPIPMVIPVLAWSVFLAIRGAAKPGLDIIGGVPAWVSWPGFAVLGSGWWLLAWLILFAWILRHASWRLDRLFAPDAAVCPACGYDLAGLKRGAACPECGRARGAEQ